MKNNPTSTFDVVLTSDTHIILVDRDIGRSVTNDAEAVIAWLDAKLPQPIGHRRVYYRDTAGRFDELCTSCGRFTDYRACTSSQQRQLAKLVDSVTPAQSNALSHEARL